MDCIFNKHIPQPKGNIHVVKPNSNLTLLILRKNFY